MNSDKSECGTAKSNMKLKHVFHTPKMNNVFYAISKAKVHNILLSLRIHKWYCVPGYTIKFSHFIVDQEGFYFPLDSAPHTTAQKS